jgi:hypothetical protein
MRFMAVAVTAQQRRASSAELQLRDHQLPTTNHPPPLTTHHH